MTIVLGLNAYHGDAAACLVRDGELVAAAEEERFRRVKHWAGFPSRAIGYCLDEAGVGLSDVAHVAINRDPSAHLLRKAAYTLLRRPDVRLVRARLANRQRWAGVEAELRSAFPDADWHGRVHHVEHHRAHMASAFLVSPFEAASVVSIDGFGDFASTAWGAGAGSRFGIEGRIFFPHSLGIFYQAMTQYLGFHNYGDEYKVMGLAAYGAPEHMEAMRDIVRLRGDGGFRLNLRYFRHHRENVAYEWAGGAPAIGPLFAPALEDALGPAREPDAALTDRHRAIARSVQERFEEALFHLLSVIHARHGGEHLALAGGCAFNSVANGRIRTCTPYRHVFVQPAAGDAGGAVGAAFAAWQELADAGRPRALDRADWGPGFDDTAIANVLAAHADELADRDSVTRAYEDEAALCGDIAQAIAAGSVVGWFQGRMEWGPRALGHRSILADPRRADMRELLNAKIKRRESFRPFAPSILRTAVGDWFEDDDDVPFMQKVYPVRADKRAAIPAVTHVDGSGRLQTVTREANPRYHRLIEAFAALTGVPMLLNTSFNENEPVVCKPEEALDCFIRTNMDMLVLGNTVIARRS